VPPRRAALAALIAAAHVLVGCRALAQAVENQACALDARTPYTVVRVDPAREHVRLYWRRPDGAGYRSFEAVRRAVEAEGLTLVAATNAGIYEPGYVPTGLYVEGGEVLVPLNTADGRGNFFLKPNGVFAVGADGRAAVVSAEDYDAGRVPVGRVAYATQSGPLLVEGGRLHPAFGAGSTSCRTRTGVGVTAGGEVVIAISNGAVNLYDFARYFRDALGAPNALYLDGGYPTRLWAPAQGRREDGAFAGILAVVRDPE
jgi:uncharacterized protein YigE (DUF2233 family)